MTDIFRQQDNRWNCVCEIDYHSVKCFKSLRQRSEVKAKVHRLSTNSLSLYSYKNTYEYENTPTFVLNTIYVKYKAFITKKVYIK